MRTGLMMTAMILGGSTVANAQVMSPQTSPTAPGNPTQSAPMGTPMPTDPTDTMISPTPSPTTPAPTTRAPAPGPDTMNDQETPGEGSESTTDDTTPPATTPTSPPMR